jgi:predicted ATPase
VAGPAGTLLVLDDLQWAGRDALDPLVALVWSEHERPLGVVGAYRDTEVGPHDPLTAVLADLAQARLVRRRVVGPLTTGEVGELLDILLAGPAQESAAPAAARLVRERVVQRAGGLPFFVVSWAQGARWEEGWTAEAVPWDMVQGLRQRVAALPAEARELLGAAAVAGREASRSLLARVAAQPEEEVVRALEAACRARLLEEAGEHTYRFAHDVIREVVEAGLGAARRGARWCTGSWPKRYSGRRARRR